MEGSAAASSNIVLFIRPFDGDWLMGDDWVIQRPYLSTILDLKAFIEKERGISKHRIYVRFRGKIISASKEKWTLRRLAIYDNTILQVEPTFPGCWLWHPLEHYIDKTLHEIDEALRPYEDGVDMRVLESSIKLPPVIKTSLRVFVKSHPERFFVTCNTLNDSLRVGKNRDGTLLPLFLPIPHELRAFRHYDDTDFDWDSYADVDQRDETDEYDDMKTPDRNSDDEGEGGLNDEEGEKLANEKVEGDPPADDLNDIISDSMNKETSVSKLDNDGVDELADMRALQSAS